MQNTHQFCGLKDNLGTTKRKERILTVAIDLLTIAIILAIIMLLSNLF